MHVLFKFIFPIFDGEIAEDQIACIPLWVPTPFIPHKHLDIRNH